MNKKIISILILVILVLAAIYLGNITKNSSEVPIKNGAPITNSISNGIFVLGYPADFGLATNLEQVLNKSVIPPCDENFDYCLYYTGNDFDDTNLESVGIRLERREDLSTEQTCLNTPPSGRTNIFPSSTTTSSYAASVFSPLGDAAAGHYSNGELYRIFAQNNCLEIETRIGESQFENYPVGTKQKFTESDRDVIYQKIFSILGSLKIASTGQNVFLPDSEN